MTQRFRLIGHDPGSNNSDSPTAWVDETDLSLVMQGWEVLDPEVIAALVEASDKHHGVIPPHELLIRWPKRMLPILKEIVKAYESYDAREADGDRVSRP